jgi:cytoskeleton protein RodZ
MTKVTRLTFGDDGSPSRRIHLREISGDVDAPLETVGQDLREARLRRGDDLASVSRVLKIRKDHLEALEEDRIDALPGRTYAVGFVRSYAEYLGLDAGQCVDRFKAEISGRNEETATVHVIEEHEHRQLPQGWKIIAGLVVLLFVYGAWHLIESARQTPSQAVALPPQSTVATTVARKVAHAPAKAPSHPKSQAVEIGGAANIPPGKQASPQPSRPSGAAAITPAPGKAVPAPAASQTAALSPQQPVALPQGQVYGEQNRNPRVILRIHEPTKVLVLGPTRMVYINRTLRPGDVYQVPNLVGLSLTTPNGGAVEIDLDGAAMGYAGKEQQMTEAFSLDPQAVVDRYNGHGG